ncbi:MAG TPA: glycosyltransferase family 4 protein [Candidatus Eisenbacteria bacterium]|jgi:glycosyltransferase involved in cell wall biosynthesis|nr:glycosyltransferase family 4 protein [Candidatus Eisenbacteria bacterium]
MKKIRVLHLIKTLGLGGAEVNLYNLVRATDHERFDIHVGYSYGGEIEQRFRDSGVRLFKYAEGSHRVKSFTSLLIIARLIRYVRRQGIQIIHTHNFNSHVWGVLAGRLAGIKVVEHVHDFRYLDPAEFRRRRGENGQYRYAKFLRGLADRVIVLTRQNRDFLLQNRLTAEKVRHIHNGIPSFDAAVPATEPARRNLLEALGVRRPAGAPRPRVIVTTARIAAEKNVDLILRIAPEVVRQVPEAVFLIAGDGPLLETLRAECRRKGLDRSVKLIGFSSDPAPLLSAADVFLLPSFLELHSISILEAMSHGVPVVVSRGVGCHDEFIADWENGVLVDPFGASGWAEAIVRLLRDEALRRTVGENGRRTCRRSFGIEVAARAKENVYVELAGQ